MIVGKSRGLTGSDYADVIELHTLRNRLKEKLKERDFVFVSKFSLQADNCIRVIFRKRNKQTNSIWLLSDRTPIARRFLHSSLKYFHHFFITTTSLTCVCIVLVLYLQRRWVGFSWRNCLLIERSSFNICRHHRQFSLLKVKCKAPQCVQPTQRIVVIFFEDMYLNIALYLYFYCIAYISYMKLRH